MSGLNLKERLERLRKAAVEAEAEQQQQQAQEPEKPLPATEENHSSLHPAFRRLGVEEVVNQAGSFLLRRIVYPYPFRHGRYGLEQLAACAPHLHAVAWRQNTKDKRKRAYVEAFSEDTPRPHARGLLFLDTETTGLGVGAGNVPFMVGIGSCTGESFVVEQTLIRHPGEERAMLTWLTEKFQGVTHLVTYNGRTFDWPVLVNRFILNGWRRKGAEPGHLDFLHPSRALWKNTLPTCRLGTVEEARLGIVRGEDVPGSLAPELYVRFLRDGNPEHLSGVYVHNEKDVLTLAALAVHFGHLLGGSLGGLAPEPVDPEERFRTGAWLEQHGRTAEAQRLYDLLAADSESRSGGETGWRLALASKYKRLGNFTRAVPMWEQAAELSEAARLPRLDAHLELAVYYEHRAKDYERALAYAEKALELAGRRISAIRASASTREEKAGIAKRVERLRNKLFRQAFRSMPENRRRPADVVETLEDRQG